MTDLTTVQREAPASFIEIRDENDGKGALFRMLPFLPVFVFLLIRFLSAVGQKEVIY